MVRGYPAWGMVRRAGQVCVAAPGPANARARPPARAGERQRRQVRGAGFGSRSRTIVLAAQPITIERVRAPHKGGGRFLFDIAEQSAATPSSTRPKTIIRGKRN